MENIPKSNAIPVLQANGIHYNDIQFCWTQRTILLIEFEYHEGQPIINI